ncbi:hypothetical protein DY000_02021641 [Brassica cretica]|uniref:Uncharacterized protein n=1 Tax=Brassica cretica TaxID=69181 RepID=A0ABQ7EHT4_BRACR|nr:hypothetical protein DY000_02021641 [Brassica cretica]
MDMGFHCLYFHCSLCYVNAKVANVKIFASSFPTTLAFSASDLGLLFGQLFLFDPEGILLFLRHGFTERRVFSSRTASCSSRMHVSLFFRIIGIVAGIQVDAPDFIILCILCGRRRVFRVLFFDRGIFARVLSRMNLPRSSRPTEWSCKVESSSANFCGSARKDCPAEKIYLNSSRAAALAFALAAEMSAAGVLRFSFLPPLSECHHAGCSGRRLTCLIERLWLRVRLICTVPLLLAPNCGNQNSHC